MSDKIEGAPGQPPQLDPTAQPQQEITQVAQDGILVGFHVIVQCSACLERGDQTPLELNISNPEMLDVAGERHKALWNDPLVVCPLCSQLAGVPCVIPIGVYAGQDAEDADAGIGLIDQQLGAAAPDDEAPFMGVDPSANPFKPIRTEDDAAGVPLPPIEEQ